MGVNDDLKVINTCALQWTEGGIAITGIITHICEGLLVFNVHLCLIYIERIYFHLRKNCILFFRGYTNTLCKEVTPSNRIVIYLCYSLLRHGLLSFGLFLLFFMLFMGLGCITFGLKAISSRLASTKQVILEFLLQICFYKDLEI